MPTLLLITKSAAVTASAVEYVSNTYEGFDFCTPTCVTVPRESTVAIARAITRFARQAESQAEYDAKRYLVTEATQVPEQRRVECEREIYEAQGHFMATAIVLRWDDVVFDNLNAYSDTAEGAVAFAKRIASTAQARDISLTCSSHIVKRSHPRVHGRFDWG